MVGCVPSERPFVGVGASVGVVRTIACVSEAVAVAVEAEARRGVGGGVGNYLSRKLALHNLNLDVPRVCGGAVRSLRTRARDSDMAS